MFRGVTGFGTSGERCFRFADKCSEVLEVWGQVVRGVTGLRASGQRYCRFSKKLSELLLSNMMYCSL